VRGSAEVTAGNGVRILGEDQSTYIPAGTEHGLRNRGTTPLELVEIRCGSYSREDGIDRFD
jgi:mannose-1-phosphate guanylyltransferase